MRHTKGQSTNWQSWVWAGWETDRHYRRMGRSGTPYFGRGQWTDDWRRRLESRETIQILADTGLNILVTHFYKGFGIEAEATEWPALQEFVAMAHEHDLRVIGYMQGSSIYYETLLAEQPQAMDWVARHRDGTPQTWGGSYYRLRPCLTSEAYVDYMSDVIRLAHDRIGLDGIHIDNSYYRHCWCERCAAGFRLWLDERGDLDVRMGIASADHIQPPPLMAGTENYSDPLAILWMQYGAQVRNIAYARLTSVARDVFPDSFVIGNPAFPRRSVYLPELGLDLHHEAGIFDALFAENGNLPAADQNQLVTQAEAYLFADAFGYQVFNTAWKTGENSALCPQTPGELWSVMAEEFSYHAVVPGNNWWLRPASDGDRMLMDDQSQAQAFIEMIRWFQSIHEEMDRSQLSQWAEVALYIQPLTLSLAWHSDRTAMRIAIAALLRLRIPVVLAIAGEPVPASVRTLLVLEQTCLSDQDMKQIAQFASQKDHHAVIMGKTGSFDEWFIPRNVSDVQAWRAGSGMSGDAGQPLTWGHELQGDRYMAADKLSGVDLAIREIASHLDGEFGPRQFAAQLPDNVMVNVESSSRKMIIHLRDQSGLGEDNSDCHLRLDPALLEGRRVCWLTPYGDADRKALEPSSVNDSTQMRGAPSQDQARLDLPVWKHYAAVILE